LGQWKVILFTLACLSQVSQASQAGQAATAACFDRHGARYGLDPALLKAIAHVESGGRSAAVNADHLARTGTKDLGLMQINTGWLPRLARFGITENDLYDACTSVEVGAWVLHDLVRRLGNTWDAVGAYNASCSQLQGVACTQARSRYAWKVYRRLQATMPGSAALAASPVAPSTALAAAFERRPAPGAPGLISVAASAASPQIASTEVPVRSDAADPARETS